MRQRRENNGTGHETPYQRCFGCLELRYGERLVPAGEAAKGYSYKHSNLQDKSLHKLQHKHDNFGRKNNERPIDE